MAFAPSSLLLGVTQHITTDVAAVPLLWVIPLALYLLTYVIVFARRPILPHAWVLRAQPYLLLLALLALFFFPFFSACLASNSIAISSVASSASLPFGREAFSRPCFT